MKRSEELQKHHDWIIDRTMNFTVEIQKKLSDLTKEIKELQKVNQ